MCILAHRKYAEMEYCLSIYKLPDSIRIEYQDVKYVNVGIPMDLCMSGTHIILSNVYIEPPE